MQIEALHPHRCELGESPLWVPEEQSLYCVDIAAREVLRFAADGQLTRWPQQAEPTTLARRVGGGLLLARRDGVFAFDEGRLTPRADPPYDAHAQRFNDGKVGPDGAWWLGTIDDARAPHAALYRGSAAGFERMQAGISNSNGLAWSPDGAWLYWADTKAHSVYRLSGDGRGARELWAQFPSRDASQPLTTYGGRPDGAAMDAQGHYWVAMFEGQQLLRLAPDGSVRESLPLPVRCPTMPCFGGPDARTLFITTAREKRPTEELAQQPLAGAVLCLRVDVPGAPIPACAW